MPVNCQIVLLDAVGKVFTRCFLAQLNTWAEDNKIIPLEQTGFRKKHGTLDNFVALQLFNEKYVTVTGSPVHAAFIDFSTAFDTFDHPTLRKKLFNLGMPGTLLPLIVALHSTTWCQGLQGGNQGQSGRLQMKNGLKQGCLLVPLLFTLYIFDLPSILLKGTGFPLSIGGRSISCLLYTDDIVIVYLTPKALNGRLVAMQQ